MKKQKNKNYKYFAIFSKSIFVFCAFLFLLISNESFSEENKKLLPNSKLLYIFDDMENKGETVKVIERSGLYDFKVLFSPHTVNVKEKYEIPLNLEVLNVPGNFKISSGENEKRIVFSAVEASTAANLQFIAKDLDIDTYIYPYFYFEYTSEEAVNFNLYFYIDIDDDDKIDFIDYYGTEPDTEITEGLASYPMNYYIRHHTEELNKSITTNLYNELRIPRADRIAFTLKKLYIEVNAGEGIAECDLGKIALYNEENRPKSVVMKQFEDAKSAGTTMAANAYDFLRENGEIAALIENPIFAINGKKYFLNKLNEETLQKLLEEKTEVDFKKLRFTEGDEVKLRVFENKYVKVKDAFLSEDIKDVLPEPKTSFNRINPTRYVVDVKAENSFWITLSENFHTGWKAYVIEDGADDTLGAEKSALGFALNSRSKLIPLKEHRVVNAFANGWFVPFDEIFGVNQPREFKIIMEFYPQRLYETGLILSSIFFVLMLIWIVISFNKKRR